MKKLIRPTIALLLLFPRGARALEVSESLWFSDNDQQHALLAGPMLCIPVLSPYLVRGSLLYGKFQNDGDIETCAFWDAAAGRRAGPFTLSAGFPYWDIDTELQPGWVWDVNTPDEKQQRNADLFGPVLRIDYARVLGSSPFALRGGCWWMFKDFGELDDLGYDGSHLGLEALLAFKHKHFLASAGYRGEFFQDMPDRLLNEIRTSRDRMRGITLAAGIEF